MVIGVGSLIQRITDFVKAFYALSFDPNPLAVGDATRN